uniref:NELL2-interacting cell ontogeny regulator 1 n=1 Tax=Rhinolophus ferrumequinum TaxID=59479 RepID=A0A671EPJ8_RHIFE
MAPPPPFRPPRPSRLLLLLLTVALLGSQARAEPAAGSAVPAQSRPCVDCHAFEFMQRALQDLRKTAYSLDARVRGRDPPGPQGCVPRLLTPTCGAAPSSGSSYPWDISGCKCHL